MQLQLINHNKIDYQKWDATLANCTNKNIYATSTYLNCLAPNWKAIVSPNWEFIMPLPCKRKFFIHYIPTIPFIQQLGIFSKLPITQSIVKEAISILKNNFFIIDYNFNASNFLESANQCNNFIKNLNHNYEALFATYSNDIKKDLTKKSELIITKNNDFNYAVDLFFELYKNRLPNLTNTVKQQLLNLCTILHHQQKLFCYQAIQQNETVAIALFFIENNRIYNIASSITIKGKKLSANHFIYNQLIKDFANTNTILDFEGSDIEGIANFYKQFGCDNQTYYHLQYKKL